MKKLALLLIGLGLLAPAFSQPAPANMETIKLVAPSKKGGKTVIEALWLRKSTREFAATPLSAQELSDLLWAANGVNRPDGRRTAPSARNIQDVEVYVCFADGNYRYDAPSHTLVPLSAGDARPLKDAPLCLVLVSDKDGRWAALDTGIVSQNISVFCAGMGLATVPRGMMDVEALAKALKLSDKRIPYLNHPVGHFK